MAERRSLSTALLLSLFVFPATCVTAFLGPHVSSNSRRPLDCIKTRPFSTKSLAFVPVDRTPTEQETSWQADSVQDSSPLAPPDAAGNPEDDFFRWMRKTWPLPVQYVLRDSGLLRLLVDSASLAAVPSLLERFPTAFADFLLLSGLKRDSLLVQQLQKRQPAQLSIEQEPAVDDDKVNYDVDFETLSYGPDPQQVVHLMSHQDATWTTSPPDMVFLHGGAWGSGFPALYRLVAKPFLARHMRVAIVGYRTYPTANGTGQVDDVIHALGRIQTKWKQESRNSHAAKKTILMGHSSGAHICALALLREERLPVVDAFVSLAGVFDIPKHYQYESGRGVERFSPLALACGGTLAQWKAQSPTRLLSSKKQMPDFPPTLVCHGALDTTVPFTSSRDFAKALLDRNTASDNDDDRKVDFELLPTVGHADMVLHLMFGGETRKVVLDWITDIEKA